MSTFRDVTHMLAIIHRCPCRPGQASDNARFARLESLGELTVQEAQHKELYL